MARFRKKLKIEDVNKNPEIEVSHTIKKIKEHELMYTIILVVFFMVLFGIIGYFTLRIDNNYNLSTSVSDNVLLGFDSSIESDVIFLNNKKIMSDKEGLNSKDEIVVVKNTTLQSFDYKLYLVPYKEQIDECGCKDKTIDTSYIRYSLDGKTVKTLNKNMLLKEGNIKGRSLQRINIKIWVDEKMDKNSDYHFHGYLKMKK